MEQKLIDPKELKSKLIAYMFARPDDSQKLDILIDFIDSVYSLMMSDIGSIDQCFKDNLIKAMLSKKGYDKFFKGNAGVLHAFIEFLSVRQEDVDKKMSEISESIFNRICNFGKVENKEGEFNEILNEMEIIKINSSVEFSKFQEKIIERLCGYLEINNSDFISGYVRIYKSLAFFLDYADKLLKIFNDKELLDGINKLKKKSEYAKSQLQYGHEEVGTKPPVAFFAAKPAAAAAAASDEKKNVAEPGLNHPCFVK